MMYSSSDDSDSDGGVSGGDVGCDS